MTIRDDYWVHNPIKVRGGLKLDESSLTQWWAQRYLDALDEFSIGHRQVRGMRYASQGQVHSLQIEAGRIDAEVQGTRKEPYPVEIGVRTFTREQWQKVFEQLSGEVGTISKLLAGVMTYDVPHIFASAGVSLFPRSGEELWTKCGCLDSSNPCKHISAVHYLLAQEFSRDPFLIITLRGLDKDRFLKELGLGEVEVTKSVPSLPEEQCISATDFWEGAKEDLPELPAIEGALTSRAALVKQLGPFPMWRGQRPLFGELRAAYSRAQSRAVDLLASRKET